MSVDYISLEDYGKSSVETENLLNIKSLGSGKDMERFAICDFCSVDRDRNGEPFVRYVFRDIEGRKIVGRQFDAKNIVDKAKVISAIQKKVVLIAYTPNYWNGFYLSVRNVKRVPSEQEMAMKSKFFTKSIPDFSKEFEYYKESIGDLIKGQNLRKVYESFDTEFKLSEGYYEDLMDGLKGSPIKLYNIFVGTAITMYDQRAASEMIIAYTFIEAILSESNRDGKAVSKNIIKFEELCETYSDPEVRLIYEIVESTIYLIYDFKKAIYHSSSLFIKTTRDFLVDTLRKLNVVNNVIGVFTEDGRIYERS